MRCKIVQAKGVLFDLGAACQKWKPMDIPCTQPPLCDGVINNYYSLFFRANEKTNLESNQNQRNSLITYDSHLKTTLLTPASAHDN